MAAQSQTAVYGVAEGVLEKLRSSVVLREIAATWGVEREVRKLIDELSGIHAVLLDAEEKQARSHALRLWLRKLKDVLYDADDLLGEFFTEDLRRRVMIQDNVVAGEVRDFFSRSNRLAFRLKMSRRIRSIWERFGMIAEEKTKFDLRNLIPSAEPEWAARETHSFVLSSDICGRDDDKKDMMRLLLDDSGRQCEVIPIVGIAGLGKTTLAQLVFNDESVGYYFKLRMWVFVSEDFDVKEIVKKIIESATGVKREGLTMDQLQNHITKILDGRRFLLVLDFVWNEDSEKWLMLKYLLSVGARGSRILVTTRSRLVADIMGTVPPYNLHALTMEASWALFMRFAFRERQETGRPDLVAIGEEIVKKCAGVPLAIRTLGAILCSKHETHEWLSVRDSEVWQFPEEGSILPMLRLSYDKLSPHLKSCFAYCSTFPRDYRIQKKTLIQLWMAQGLIQSSDSFESLEDIGNHYVEQLLLRSFFQDIEMGVDGGIISFKMHDLMHDLAHFVAGTECLVVKDGLQNISGGIFHMSFDSFFSVSENVPEPFVKAKKLRTLLMPVQFWLEDTCFRDKLITSFKYLRVLDLQNSGMEKVPSSIGELIHLRYLDLSMNLGVRLLPNSISNLLNLQTLKLLNCEKLQELPVDMRNMISLRHIEINSVAKLTHMPSHMGRLLSLQTLPIFIVGMATSSSKHSNGGLSELHGLDQLRGELHILNLENSMELDAKEAKLMNKQYLQALDLAWNQDSPRQYALTNDDAMRGDNLLLEGLQPHQNLKELSIKGYVGREFPRWMMKSSLSLPNLVEISLCNCIKCEHLPPLAELNSLRALTLKNLPALEYFDKGTISPSLRRDVFFPSLKYLSLSNMPNLAGWSRKDSEYGVSERASNRKYLSSFPCLAKLTIKCCPKLRHLPLHQTLEEVELNDFHAELLELMLMGLETKKLSEKASTSLPKEGLEGLSSLRSLSIVNCPELASLSQGMQFLTALEMLKIQWCPMLNLSDDKDRMQGLRSLRSLKLSGLPTMLSLPDGLQHATALQYLCIEYCKHLKTLPAWLEVLSSLRELDISCCPNLLHLSEGMQNLTSLQSLSIGQCPRLLTLPEEGLRGLTSLLSLFICHCENLVSLSRGIQHLTALKELRIYCCERLDLSDEEDFDGGLKLQGLSSLNTLRIEGIPKLVSLPNWLRHAANLTFLKIKDCSGLANLPEWIGNLSSLQELQIFKCPALESLPEGMRCLTSLKFLDIQACPYLLERCREDRGED